MSAGKAVGDVATLLEFPTDSQCRSTSSMYGRASTHGTGRRDNKREDPFCSPLCQVVAAGSRGISVDRHHNSFGSRRCRGPHRATALLFLKLQTMLRA